MADDRGVKGLADIYKAGNYHGMQRDRTIAELGDLLKGADITYNVLVLENNPKVVRPLIEKRMRLSDKIAGIEEGSFLKVDDSAYREIETLTGGNPSFALYVFENALRLMWRESKRHPEVKPPYIMTGEHISRLGIIEEEFHDWVGMDRPAIIQLD